MSNWTAGVHKHGPQPHLCPCAPSWPQIFSAAMESTVDDLSQLSQEVPTDRMQATLSRNTSVWLPFHRPVEGRPTSPSECKYGHYKIVDRKSANQRQRGHRRHCQPPCTDLRQPSGATWSRRSQPQQRDGELSLLECIASPCGDATARSSSSMHVAGYGKNSSNARGEARARSPPSRRPTQCSIGERLQTPRLQRAYERSQSSTIAARYDGRVESRAQAGRHRARRVFPCTVHQLDAGARQCDHCASDTEAARVCLFKSSPPQASRSLGRAYPRVRFLQVPQPISSRAAETRRARRSHTSSGHDLLAEPPPPKESHQHGDPDTHRRPAKSGWFKLKLE